MIFLSINETNCTEECIENGFSSIEKNPKNGFSSIKMNPQKGFSSIEMNPKNGFSSVEMNPKRFYKVPHSCSRVMPLISDEQL